MRQFITSLVVPTVLALASASAFAVPVLQLDIEGGTYDNSADEQSIVTGADTFNLLAYGTANGNVSEADLIAGPYYLSIALTPKVNTPTNLGSFKVNGVTYDATNDLVFGTAPLASTGLAPHGIFDTYFLELVVDFNTMDKSGSYNTMDTAGIGIQTPTGMGDMFYDLFTIDKSMLDDSVQLHFDLYDTQVKNNGTITIDSFAPFSHDASTVVPEPATLMLTGIGLCGLLIGRRRKLMLNQTA